MLVSALREGPETWQAGPWGGLCGVALEALVVPLSRVLGSLALAP